jgi:hypothetical protein
MGVKNTNAWAADVIDDIFKFVLIHTVNSTDWERESGETATRSGRELTRRSIER